MFDNRWDNWAGDFGESFAVEQFDVETRGAVSEILTQFGRAVRSHDLEFPDEIGPNTFARVLTGSMLRLALPDPVRKQVPEVIATFLEYLQESGRVGEGSAWASEIRELAPLYAERLKPDGGVKGVTIRHSSKVTPVGRNDPCPCGSGKKFKKCCMGV